MDDSWLVLPCSSQPLTSPDGRHLRPPAHRNASREDCDNEQPVRREITPATHRQKPATVIPRGGWPLAPVVSVSAIGW